MAPKLLFDISSDRMFVAGHRGLVGSAIVRRLAQENCEVLTADRAVVDLSDQRATENWLQRARPDAIFLAAGLVGGIHANNTYPADFIARNLAIRLTLSAPLMRLESKSYSLSGRRAYTPNMPNSRCARTCCSPVRWNRPMNGTQSPRSRRSNYVKRIANSMEMILSLSCQPTCTAPTTTIIH